MSDPQEQLAALRRRDPAAFAALFDEYADRIYRLALGLLGDEQEADAVVQDTFLRLFERLDQFEGRSSLGTWLYRVAYNRCMDQLRRSRPVQTLDGAGDEPLPLPANLTQWGRLPEQQLTDEEIRQALDQAILSLPDHYRIIFILREIEGLSTAQAAEVAGVSVSAAKVRLHRARLQLRERLAAHFAVPAQE